MLFPCGRRVLILKPLLIKKGEVGGLHDQILCTCNVFEPPYIFVFLSWSRSCGCRTKSPGTQRCKTMVCKLVDSGGLGIQTRAQQDWLVSASWCLGAQLEDLKAGTAPIPSLIRSLLINRLMQTIGCSLCSCPHGFSLCGLSALVGLDFLRA